MGIIRNRNKIEKEAEKEAKARANEFLQKVKELQEEYEIVLTPRIDLKVMAKKSPITQPESGIITPK